MANQKSGPAGFGSKKENKPDGKDVKEQNDKKANQQADLGHFLYRQGRLEQAEAIYKALIQAQARNGLILGNLAAIYARQGKLQEAAELLEEALAIDPSFAEGWATLGFVQKAKGNITGAIQAYAQSLLLVPDNCYCHYNLGNALSQVGRFNEAIEAYGQAVELHPQFLEALTNRGSAFLEVGEHQKAVSSCLNALSINPNHLAALNNLGKAYQGLGDNPSAIDTFKRAIEFNAMSPDLFFNLGSALKDVDLIEEAVDAYQEALRLRPEFSEAHSNLGALYAQLGNLSEAIVCYELALNYKPNLVEALLNLAKAYNAKKSDNEAIAAYNKALLISPELSDAERRLSLLVDANVDPAPLVRAQNSLLTAVDPENRAQLYFTIAKYKEDLDDPSALDSYQKGNQEMAKLLSWEHPNLKKLIEANEAISETSSTWQDDHEPLFLVGMPCCGAELAQLILSKNPDLGSLWRAEFLNMASNYMLDSNVNSIADNAIASIKAMHRDRDVAKPITDHALFGFQYCSAIAKMFPRARILHCYCNPIDNLFAIYKSYLGTENPWAYDLDLIIEYFDFYRQVMAYHEANSPGAIINLDMDALRANPRVEIRELIQRCGFKWADAYLGPDILAECEKQHPVSTVADRIIGGSEFSWLTKAQLVAELAEKLEARGYAMEDPL